MPAARPTRFAHEASGAGAAGYTSGPTAGAQPAGAYTAGAAGASGAAGAATGPARRPAAGIAAGPGPFGASGGGGDGDAAAGRFLAHRPNSTVRNPATLFDAQLQDGREDQQYNQLYNQQDNQQDNQQYNGHNAQLGGAARGPDAGGAAGAAGGAGEIGAAGGSGRARRIPEGLDIWGSASPGALHQVFGPRYM